LRKNRVLVTEKQMIISPNISKIEK